MNSLITNEDKLFYSKNKYFFYLLFFWCIRITFLKQGNAGGVAINKYVVLQIIIELALLYSLFIRKYVFSDLFYLKPVKGYINLYFLGVLSVFWGIMPFMGCYFALQNIIMISVFCYLLMQSKNFFQLERFFFQYNLFLICLYILSSFYFGGDFHSVTFSSIGGYLLLYSVAEYININRSAENIIYLKIGIVVGIIVLIISTSSGAIVATVCGLLALAFLSDSCLFRIVSSFCFSVCIWGYYTGYHELLISVIFPGKSIQSIETGHGRTYLWNLIIEKASQRPLLGWGYASIERSLSEIYAVDAHNSFVGTLGNLGYCGLFLLIYAMLGHLLFLYKNRKYYGMRGMLIASICGIVNSNTSNFITSKEGCQSLAFQFLFIFPVFFYFSQKKDHPQDKIL